MLVGVVVFFIVGAALFSPWAIRNIVWTRNPVFPEGQQLFGRAHFSPVQSERWRLAHSPPRSMRSPGARLVAAFDQILADRRFGFLVTPLALIAICLAWRRREAWMAVAMILILTLFWLCFTHLQGRFFVLAIPLTGLLIAQARATAIVGALVTLQFAMTANYVGTKFIDRANAFRENRLLAVEDLKGFLPQDVEDAMQNANNSFALVGDARAFLYQVPMSKLSYRTVFDVDVKPGQSIVDAWLAGQSGSPMIVIDPSELERFSKTYHGIPPLPADFPGPRDREYILSPHRD
jgi:hypothetical protein